MMLILISLISLKLIDNNNYESWLVVWVSCHIDFVGYLMPNPLSYKKSFLFQTIQFSMSTQFNC